MKHSHSDLTNCKSPLHCHPKPIKKCFAPHTPSQGLQQPLRLRYNRQNQSRRCCYFRRKSLFLVK